MHSYMPDKLFELSLQVDNPHCCRHPHFFEQVHWRALEDWVDGASKAKVWARLLTYPFVAFRLAPEQTALPPCEWRFLCHTNTFFEAEGEEYSEKSGGIVVGRARFPTACMQSRVSQFTCLSCVHNSHKNKLPGYVVEWFCARRDPRMYVLL